MLATYAASRHRQIVPCCMISSVSHDNVSRLVTDRSMCFATALDKAFENIDCMSAILRCQAKNRFYESTQRLIQPRRVLCPRAISEAIECMPGVGFSAHGFRAALATYGPQDLGWAPADSKIILDHMEGFDPADVTAQHYNTDPEIAKKRAMMRAWTDWLEVR